MSDHNVSKSPISKQTIKMLGQVANIHQKATDLEGDLGRFLVEQQFYSDTTKEYLTRDLGYEEEEADDILTKLNGLAGIKNPPTTKRTLKFNKKVLKQVNLVIQQQYDIQVTLSQVIEELSDGELLEDLNNKLGEISELVGDEWKEGAPSNLYTHIHNLFYELGLVDGEDYDSV
jgi:hypothetical protein